MTLAIITKASLSTAPGANAATADPTATPAMAGIAQARTISMRTAPRAQCARNDDKFVGTMIAMDVPRQAWNRTASETPSAPNTS